MSSAKPEVLRFQNLFRSVYGTPCKVEIVYERSSSGQGPYLSSFSMDMADEVVRTVIVAQQPF